MGITPWTKLPYPEPTDPVAQGAANIKALATATEKAIPAVSLSPLSGGVTIGRGPGTGDRLRVVQFMGGANTNQYGQFAITLPAGIAGYAYAAASAQSDAQNGALIYCVLDRLNSSVSNAIFFTYAQSNNAIMANYGASVMVSVFAWEAIAP